MSRLADLEVRRRVLLARCAMQRVDLARRVSRLHAGVGGAAFATAPGADGRAARHPLAWIAALAGLAVLGRTRDVLTVLAWVRTALSVASRAAQLLGLIGAVRARRSARARSRARA